MNSQSDSSSQPERPQSLSEPVQWRTFHFLYEGTLNLLRVWILAVYCPRQLYLYLHKHSHSLDVEDRILFGTKAISISSKSHKVLGPWQYIVETATATVVLLSFTISIMNLIISSISSGQVAMPSLTGVDVIDGLIYGASVTALILAASFISALFAAIFLSSKCVRKRFLDLAAYSISTSVLSIGVGMSSFACIYSALWFLVSLGISPDTQWFSFSIVILPFFVLTGILMYLFVYFSIEVAIRLVVGGIIVLYENFSQEKWRIACMVGVVLLFGSVLFYLIGVFYRVYT